MASFETLFADSLTVSPPLDDDVLKAVPGKRGVFLLVSQDDQPVLLTTAADIRSRVRNRLAEPPDDTRKKSADLRQVTSRVYWTLAYSAFETDWRFFHLARAVWPDTYKGLLSVRPAWFVGVDADEEFPRFARTRQVGPPGVQFGPFPDKHAAERFVGALTDAFDLCRYYHILRQAPHGAPCPYKQMGRSSAACDGSIPMSQYREMIRSVADFAGGSRQAFADRLRTEMYAASGAMEFERASLLKTRLDRLADFDAPKFAYVGPVEAFRWIIVQTGRGAGRLNAFVCDSGAIREVGELRWPAEPKAMAKVLDACDRLAIKHAGVSEADRYGMGLVTSYLFSGKAKRGLFVRRDELAAPGDLGERIAAAGDVLGLQRRAKKHRGSEPEPGPSSQ